MIFAVRSIRLDHLAVDNGMSEPGTDDSNIRGWYYNGKLHQGNERV